jgi:predicted transcriptional regulator
MTVSEISEKLNLKVLSGNDGCNKNVDGAYVSDLLSDVMGNATEGQIWITLQTHKNIMAIASLKELAAVILVKGLLPAKDCELQSNVEHIPILSTDLETFEIAGKLYSVFNKV